MTIHKKNVGLSNHTKNKLSIGRITMKRLGYYIAIWNMLDRSRIVRAKSKED